MNTSKLCILIIYIIYINGIGVILVTEMNAAVQSAQTTRVNSSKQQKPSIRKHTRTSAPSYYRYHRTGRFKSDLAILTACHSNNYRWQRLHFGNLHNIWRLSELNI